LNYNFIKCIFYLFKRDFGGWRARWGVNFIYAIGAVLPGLGKIGYDLN
jgi:hypothetical protein